MEQQHQQQQQYQQQLQVTQQVQQPIPFRQVVQQPIDHRQMQFWQPHTDYVKKTPRTGFLMPPPGIGAPALGGAGGHPGKGVRRLLGGGKWVMPGLILHMPDPLGVGLKRRYTITEARERRYGAREPIHKVGAVRA